MRPEVRTECYNLPFLTDKTMTPTSRAVRIKRGKVLWTPSSEPGTYKCLTNGTSIFSCQEAKSGAKSSRKGHTEGQSNPQGFLLLGARNIELTLIWMPMGYLFISTFMGKLAFLTRGFLAQGCPPVPRLERPQGRSNAVREARSANHATKRHAPSITGRSLSGIRAPGLTTAGKRRR